MTARCDSRSMNPTEHKGEDEGPKRPPRIISIVLAGWLASTVVGCGAFSSDSTTPDAWIEIKGRRVSLDVVDTPRSQGKGLGGRDSLAWHHGMYFEYDRPAFYSFWMKGMRFSIDIIWLRDGRVVAIDANVPYEKGGNGPTLQPGVLIDGVLEVPAGYATAHAWQIGDRAVYERVKAE
ncbi:MAG TPA: DUF192 domain-containing protein [Myxococcales bacterium]|nr:DUF192 domain-containing protein [Myxococcales bacterium]HIK85262.1 DUF192 domain-containing protein [Myxococcales bacterium]